MAEKFLAVDVGNTRIKATWFASAEAAPEVYIFDAGESERLLSLVEEKGAQCGAMASVGHVDPRLAESLRLAFGGRFLLVTPSTPLPLAVAYDDARNLGLDRKCTSVAVSAEYPRRNVLVIDAGSALTCDVVTPAGFVAGSISPGLSMRFRALADFTAALPAVEAPRSAAEVPAFACGTRGAILSGVGQGLLHEVVGDILDIGVARYGIDLVVLTGGDAPFIAGGLAADGALSAGRRRAIDEIKIIHDPHLLAKGIRIIYLHHENEF